MLIFFIVACKNYTTAPLPAPTTSVILEGTVVYASIPPGYPTVHPIGSPQYPTGYYLSNPQRITQISDTGSFVFLSGKIDSSYINKKVWIEGLDSIKTLGGPLYSINYMLFTIDSIYVIN